MKKGSDELVKHFPATLKVLNKAIELGPDAAFFRVAFERYDIMIRQFESAAGVVFERAEQFGVMDRIEFQNPFFTVIVIISRFLKKNKSNPKADISQEVILVFRFFITIGKFDGDLFAILMKQDFVKQLFLRVNQEMELLYPDDALTQLQTAAKNVIDLKSENNIFKEGLCIFSFLSGIVNTVFKTGRITDVTLQLESRMFFAITKNPARKLRTSICDIVIMIQDAKGIAKRLRVEVKAWQGKNFIFKGVVPDITDDTVDDLVQAYRYIFESVFVEADMTTLAYVIPKNTSPDGIKAESIRKVLNHMMNADAGYLQTLFNFNGGPFRIRPSDAGDTLRHKLAYDAFQAASANNDLSIKNIMNEWDKLLAAAKANGDKTWDSIEPWAGGKKDHAAMATALQQHLDPPHDSIERGIIEIDNPFE